MRQFSHGSPLLGIDLWTRLRADPQPRLGKPYHGRLVVRDTDYALFTEDPPAKPQRRNPRIFDGRYVTLTRREGDGHLRLNFKELPFPPGLDDEAYAHAVGQEVAEALALCHVGSDQIRNATCLDKNNTCQDKNVTLLGETLHVLGRKRTRSRRV